jgi:hypothetical protein
MVALLFGQFSNPVHESQRGPEIGKLEGTREVMLVDKIPLAGFRQLPMDFSKFISLQRRYTAAAGDAISVCKHKPSS